MIFFIVCFCVVVSALWSLFFNWYCPEPVVLHLSAAWWKHLELQVFMCLTLQQINTKGLNVWLAGSRLAWSCVPPSCQTDSRSPTEIICHFKEPVVQLVLMSCSTRVWSSHQGLTHFTFSDCPSSTLLCVCVYVLRVCRNPAWRRSNTPRTPSSVCPCSAPPWRRWWRCRRSGIQTISCPGCRPVSLRRSWVSMETRQKVFSGEWQWGPKLAAEWTMILPSHGKPGCYCSNAGVLNIDHTPECYWLKVGHTFFPWWRFTPESTVINDITVL